MRASARTWSGEEQAPIAPLGVLEREVEQLRCQLATIGTLRQRVAGGGRAAELRDAWERPRSWSCPPREHACSSRTSWTSARSRGATRALRLGPYRSPTGTRR